MKSIFTLSERTKFIKAKALEYGFDDCKIAKAVFLEDEAPLLEKWLNNNYHGDMYFMTKHFDKRLDPRLLLKGAKSVIMLQKNYFPSKKEEFNGYKISKYAYGEDYHTVIRKQINTLIPELQLTLGKFAQRSFVDSGPTLERAWAKRAGMSWIGKHTIALSPKKGSFYFLAEIICDLELEYDTPINDFCGTCTKCIDACPTEAIVEPYVVDSNKCISYLTIELKEAISEEFKGKMDEWAYGCDICQDVCPWNRFAEAHNESKFMPTEGLKSLQELQNVAELSEDFFNSYFGNSAIKRAQHKGLVRNLTFILPSDK